MPSLLEALEEKYGLGNSDLETQSLVSIFVPKLPPRTVVPELLVLNDCNIDCAGEAEDLKKKVFPVKELDLAQNKLENWHEVFSILSHMPRVEFVNLSLNRLLGPVIPPPDLGISKLKSLVLNNTRLEWESVESLLNFLPALDELHLSLNDYHNVLLDTDDDFLLFDDLNEIEIIEEDENENTNVCLCEEVETVESENNLTSPTATTSSNTEVPITPLPSYKRTDSTSSNYKKTNPHSGVQMLHFTGNPVTDWSEICRLGRIFPNLKSLVLAECPIRAVEEIPKPPRSDTAASNDPTSTTNSSTSNSDCDKEPPHIHFQNLEFLNLSSTNINTWDDIDRLAKFPALKKLRVQNWPLWDKCEATEHERRQLLIARLPTISILNGGGVVGAEEREDAERAFIRYYMDKPESDRPERYNELLEKHGKLDPLVNIDLRPEKRVKITFSYGENSETRTLDVYRTVADLKLRLERFTGIPASKMNLYYVDNEVRDIQGPEKMTFPNKQLYRYNIRTGDEIIIEQKQNMKACTS